MYPEYIPLDFSGYSSATWTCIIIPLAMQSPKIHIYHGAKYNTFVNYKVGHYNYTVQCLYLVPTLHIIVNLQTDLLQ